VRNALILLVASLLCPTVAAVEIHSFDDPTLDRRFRDLTFELRCLVCQNQNIADSDADLAKDLRTEVDRMLREGKTNNDIRDFMVARYGEFVLYKPRFRAGTFALWAGPFVLLAAGLAILILHVRRTRRAAAATLSPEEQARAEALLQDDDSPGERR